jgi:hypothetical protein
MTLFDQEYSKWTVDPLEVKHEETKQIDRGVDAKNRATRGSCEFGKIDQTVKCMN